MVNKGFRATFQRLSFEAGMTRVTGQLWTGLRSLWSSTKVRWDCAPLGLELPRADLAQPLWAAHASASLDSFPCAPSEPLWLPPPSPWYQGLLSAPPEPSSSRLSQPIPKPFLMGQLLQRWPSCFWYSRKWLLPWRRVHPVLQGNRRGELHWHTPQHHLTPRVQGTTILCQSLALLQAGLQLNQYLPIISCLCGSIPSILWKKWQQLQTSSLLLSFLFSSRAAYKANPQTFYSYKQQKNFSTPTVLRTKIKMKCHMIA